MNRQHLLAAVFLQVAPAFVFAAPPHAVADPVQVSAFGVPVMDTKLSEYRGARNISFNEQHTDGQLYDNQSINTVSGHNVVSGDAFSSMNGFSTVIQNSGNNVLIQNSTIVNVQVQ